MQVYGDTPLLEGAQVAQTSLATTARAAAEAEREVDSFLLTLQSIHQVQRSPVYKAAVCLQITLLLHLVESSLAIIFYHLLQKGSDAGGPRVRILSRPNCHHLSTCHRSNWINREMYLHRRWRS